MRIWLATLFLLLLFAANCFGQSDANALNCGFLLGKWEGKGSGEPGKGGGKFTFERDLDQKVILRKSHTTYPAKDGKPAFNHDDLLIIYADETKAIYFDNEGHTINYSISSQDKSITLTSEKVTNMPIFRLIYSLIDKKIIGIRFEMSLDGSKFNTYLEGTAHRLKSGK